MGLDEYHIRHPHKSIEDEEELDSLILGQKYMTLAMCKDGEPYLATVNYGYDANGKCFYFHCSPVGKKSDFLKANPVVWGQVLDDRGYIQGECDHAFRTVQFKGSVEFLSSIEEKKKALTLMMEQLEDEPDEVKKRLLETSKLEKVAIGKVTVGYMSGKENVPKDEGG